MVDERTKALLEEIKVRKRAEEKLAHMANYDALTGLPNRRLFHKLLSRLLLEAEASGQLAGCPLHGFGWIQRGQ